MESFVTNNITLRCLKCMITGRGSTNAGMDWNGMDYWNGQKKSNSLGQLA